jgi:hypothetical protein
MMQYSRETSSAKAIELGRVHFFLFIELIIFREIIRLKKNKKKLRKKKVAQRNRINSKITMTL